jgi:hypothetical protein
MNFLVKSVMLECPFYYYRTIYIDEPLQNMV